MIAPRLHPMVNRRGLTFWAMWLTGSVVSCVLLGSVIYAHFGGFPPPHRALMVIGVLASVPIYSALHVYHKRLNYAAGLLRLLAGWCVLVGTLGLVAMASGSPESIDPDLALQAIAFGYWGQAAAFVPLRFLLNRHTLRLKNDRKAVIIGSGELAAKLARQLKPRVPVLGVVALEQGADAVVGLATLGSFAELRQIIQRAHVRRVYIALSLDRMVQIESIYVDLLDLAVDVVWVPDFGSMMLLNQSISQIEQIPAIYLNETPLSSHPAAAFGKDLIERCLALLALVVLAPVMLAVAVAVKLSSPGPVFFRQGRDGCNGKVIQVYKFRSMRMHDDQDVKQATRNDSRVTRVGAFLRRTSLDELPQLFNVLSGEMALVGPRPHAIAHNHYYCGKLMAYMARHRIKPGITGLAQVNGFRGETETLEKMQGRLERDLAYINHWSLWLDIKILLKTPFTLFSKNIY
ncbi:undecaprenyl-phosphate glucose phosphotransferase [Pseudomonas typographi]|uniref:Undecaprenyl-phosphate glucose phosphotransferase n=1 Tax=Pseudomonas typographi TaxID=2715964 RepID=A0ABR7Z6Z0_9PSED|nr:undecaprenyl-phosphate glucose phosphotransferase [Pseudomonas typographi]MBD1601315.1 undecaprenyl-phosphate glucose phosphotransferase [Pseudomonas typographi]